MGKPRYVVPAALAPVALVTALVLTGGGRAGVGNAGDSQAGTAGVSSGEGGDPGPDVERLEAFGDTSKQAVGAPVAVGGLVVTVTDLTLGQGSRGQNEVVVLLTLVNESDDSRPYAAAAFSLVTEAGAVVRPSPSDGADALGFGTLEPNGEVIASLTFEAGPGAHTLLLDPPTPDGRRLSWPINV